MGDFTPGSQHMPTKAKSAFQAGPYLSMAPSPFLFIFLSGSSLSSFCFFSLPFALPLSFFFSFSFVFLAFLTLLSRSSCSELPGGADSQFGAPWPECELLSDSPSVQRKHSHAHGQGHPTFASQEELKCKTRQSE